MSSRQLALHILREIDERHGFANIDVPAALSRSMLDARDKALVTELVYGVLRYQLALDWLIGRFTPRPAAKIEPAVRDLLRLGIYQLIYLDKVPAHAAVDTSVELAKVLLRPGVDKFINAVLRRASRSAENLPWPDPAREASRYLSVFYSHPQWLVELWLAELGQKTTEALLAADNWRPKVNLRTNTLKTSAATLLAVLRRQGLEAVFGNICPEAIILAGQSIPENVIRDGLAYAQNEASMAVAAAMAPGPGESVIDLCAAPGGKATHLAQLMGDKGRIVAVDKSKSRLDLVKNNCARLGINIVETLAADATVSLPLPKVEHVLVDAPCSGLGVLARRPDSRWQKTAADIPRLADLQLKLLIQGAKYLKPGGILTYSVCTITNAETVEVIDKFAALSPDLQRRPVVVADQTFAEAPWARFWPHIHETDGMFIAQFKMTRA